MRVLCTAEPWCSWLPLRRPVLSRGALFLYVPSTAKDAEVPFDAL
ncbi:hypothetical protein ABZX90_25315 [Streptomyces sp. NPDC002935]